MNCANQRIIGALLWIAGGALLLAAGMIARSGTLPDPLIGLLGAIAAGLLAALNRGSNSTPETPPKDESHEA